MNTRLFGKALVPLAFMLVCGSAVAADYMLRSPLPGSDQDAAKTPDLPPSLHAVSPNSGSSSGYESITLTGTHFQPGATVQFGVVPALDTFIVDTTTLSATTPPHEAGAVDVTVVNPSGKRSTLASSYTFEHAVVQVSSITPNSGSTSGGETVTITGSGFDQGTKVYFGEAPSATVTVSNEQKLTAVVPAGTLGAVDVRVEISDDVSDVLASGYNYESVLVHSHDFNAVSTGTLPAGYSVISGYGVGEEMNWSVEYSGAFSGRALRAAPSTIGGGAILTPVSQQDGRMRVAFRHGDTAGEESAWNEQPGLILRWQDASNHIRFRMPAYDNPPAGAEPMFEIVEYVNGSWVIHVRTPFDWTRGAKYTIDTSVRGQTLTYVVQNSSGQPVLSGEHTLSGTPGAGGWAIRNGAAVGGTAEFDDLFIWN